MVTSEFPPRAAGTGNYVYNISQKLVQKGHKVTVVTRGSAGSTVKEIVNGVEVYKAPFIPIYPLHVPVHGIFVNRLVKGLESELTLIHSHIPFPPRVKSSLPMMTTVHTPMRVDARHCETWDFYSLAERLQSEAAYGMELDILRDSDLVTSVSRSVALELREYGMNPSRIKVLGNGVDERVYMPASCRTDSDSRYILYTGRLSFRKGLFDLIECARSVCRAHQEVSFLIVGKGPLLGRLQNYVRKMGLENRIRFLGYVEKNKLVQLYQDATAYVLPSHYEGLPTVLLEAMSCGLPVVATAVSGNTEVISPENNGILVPAGQPNEMAGAISRLLNDENLRERLGKNARRTIEECYTVEKTTENVLECYRSVL